MPNRPIADVIDDDAAVRKSLTVLLSAAGISARAHISAAHFLAYKPPLNGGCIITDVRMPDLDGVTFIKRLRAEGVHLPVIVITAHGDVPLAVEAMKVGACDFFEKPLDIDRLLSSVRAALQSEAAQEIEEATLGKLRERLSTLTTREHEVLKGLILGRPNKAIAHHLKISPRTVEKFRANVMSKMKANSLSELVRMALTLEI